MRPKKYPLAHLRRLKKERADTKARELAQSIIARETAERVRRTAEAERETARARAEAVRQGERAALEKGELRAADLARTDAWERRAAAEDGERTREVERARSEARQAGTRETRAQGDVAVARAEVEATARHEQRWTSAARKADEAREEEALAEAVPPKNPR